MKDKSFVLSEDEQRFYRSLMMSCNSREIPFRLNKDQFAELRSRNCAYCGGSNGEVNIIRLDPGKKVEMTMDNCESVCSVCLLMKGTLKRKKFIKQCRDIFENHVAARASLSGVTSSKRALEAVEEISVEDDETADLTDEEEETMDVSDIPERLVKLWSKKINRSTFYDEYEENVYADREGLLRDVKKTKDAETHAWFVRWMVE